MSPLTKGAPPTRRGIKVASVKGVPGTFDATLSPENGEPGVRRATFDVMPLLPEKGRPGTRVATFGATGPPPEKGSPPTLVGALVFAAALNGTPTMGARPIDVPNDMSANPEPPVNRGAAPVNAPMPAYGDPPTIEDPAMVGAERPVRIANERRELRNMACVLRRNGLRRRPLSRSNEASVLCP